MKSTATRILIAFSLAGLSLAGTAQAQTDIFLCSDTLKGETFDSQFKGCVELTAVGEHISRPVAETSDKTATGAAQLGPIQIFKEYDRASLGLRREALKGSVFNAQIYFRSGGDDPYVYLEMELEETSVVSVTMDARTDGQAAEAAELVARRVTWRYNEQGKDGSVIGGEEFSWDFSGR